MIKKEPDYKVGGTVSGGFIRLQRELENQNELPIASHLAASIGDNRWFWLRERYTHRDRGNRPKPLSIYHVFT